MPPRNRTEQSADRERVERCGTCAQPLDAEGPSRAQAATMKLRAEANAETISDLQQQLREAEEAAYREGWATGRADGFNEGRAQGFQEGAAENEARYHSDFEGR